MSEMEELPEGQDMFPRKYVEELRDEAAKYRTRSSTYEEAFSGLKEQEAEYMLEALRGIGADDVSGAFKLREVSQIILGERFTEGLDMPENSETNNTEETVTDPTDIEAIVAKAVSAAVAQVTEQFQAQQSEAQKEAAKQSEAEQLFQEIESHGVKRGTPQFQAVLALAEVEAVNDRPVDFAVLSEKVGLLYPAADGEASEDEEGPEAPNVPSVDMNSQGSPSGEAPKSFLDLAKEEAGPTGRVDFMKAAGDAADAFFAELD